MNCCPPGKTPRVLPDPRRWCSYCRICWKLFSGRFISALGHHFEEVVLAMLLGEEEPTIANIRRVAAQKTFDRRVTIGVVKPGRLVILVNCHSVLSQGHETCRIVRKAHVVGPDGVELVELIV